MTDKNKIEMQVQANADPRLVNQLEAVIRQASDLERRFDSIFGRSERAAQQLGAILKNLKVQQAGLDTINSRIAKGSVDAQILNARTAGAIADRRADPYLRSARLTNVERQREEERAKIYQQALDRAGSGASKAQVKAAFRALLAESGIYAAPANAAERKSFDKEFARGEAAFLNRQTLAIEKVMDRAGRENSDRDAKARKAWDALYDKALRTNFDRDSRLRGRQEDLARRSASTLLKSGGLDTFLSRGDVNSASDLVGKVRSIVKDRYGFIDDQFIDQALRGANAKIDLGKAAANLKAAEAELGRFYNEARKIKDLTERNAAISNYTRATAKAYGVSEDGLSRSLEGRVGEQSRREQFLPPAADRPQRQGSSRLGRLAGRLQLFGDYAGISAVVGAFGYVGYQTVQLEKALSTLQAISRATDTQMAQLGETIFSVGRNTGYTNTELSQAATVLAQAGYSAQQVSKVLPDIANLALASGSAIDDTAPLVSSVLTIFEKGMGESSYVVDVLTQALNGSKLSLEQFSLGIQYAGNIAADSGITFEEMAATLGAVSNAGIRSGSTLGTGFRAMLQELQAPSEGFLQFLETNKLTLEDINVRTRGLIPVLETLKQAGLDSQAALGVFDVRAASFYSAASRNLDVAESMQDGFAGNGAAAAAAAAQMDTLAAQMTRLGNVTVDLALSAGGPLLNAFKALVKGLADVIAAMADSPKLLQSMIAGLVTYKVVMAAASVANSLFAASTLRANGALNLFNITWKRSPMGLIAGLLAAVAGGMVYLSQKTQRATDAAEQHKNKADELSGELDELGGVINELDKFSDDLTTSNASLAQQVEEAERRFARYGLELGSTITTTAQLREETDRLTQSLRDNQLAKAREKVEELRGERAGLQQTGASQVVAAWNGAGFGISPVGQSLLNNPDYKAIKQGQGTERNYRNLISTIERMEANASPNEKRALAQFRQSILSSGTYAALSANGAGLSSTNALIRSSTIASSPMYANFESEVASIASMVANWVGPDGNIKADEQGRFDRVVVPRLMQFLEDSVAAIVRENPALAGQEDDIRLALQSEQEFAGLMGYRSGQQGVSQAARTRQRTAAEARWKTATPQERQRISEELRQLYIQQYRRENDDATIVDARAYAEQQLALLQDGVQTGQASRSQNRALEQAAENARREVGLSAQRLNSSGGAAGTWMRPISASEGSPFGASRSNGPHRGSDYPAQVGTSVVAPLGGFATGGYSDANGNFVRIDHGNGFESMLIHLDSIAANLGEVVQGQEVGKSGNTGASRGPHLHWQLKLNGEVIDPESMVGQQAIDTAAQVIKTAQADFDDKWEAYVSARMAAFEDQTSEMTSEERSQERTALLADLALERAELLKQNLDQVYAIILANFGFQAEDAIARALNVASSGQDASGLVEVARLALLRQRDAAIKAAEAQMEAGAARDVEIQKIMREYSDRIAGLTVGVIEATAQAAAREFEASQARVELNFRRRQSAFNQQNNPANQRNGSDVYWALQRNSMEGLSRDQARNALTAAQGRYNLAYDSQAALDSAYRSATSEQDRQTLLPLLQAAETKTEEMRLNLLDARMAFEELTAEAYQFQTPTEAIAASWAAFIEEMNLGRPVLNTLADGLLETFKTANQGFKSMVVDVLSGTKTMGDAFRDFSASVLSSLLDLAAEIIANEILKMIVGAFTGGTGIGGFKMPGGGGTPGFGSLRAYHGGALPRFAQGGAAPFRDSMLALVQPGEFIMSRTATDFIGRDALREMNSQGNRRMSRMPTLAQAMPQREKDEVNVWVVPPTQRPPVTKKDIVAAISEDIMLNGQTKKLIKNVQMGG
ncbi:MAG: phage tail tape measure protein [Brevundimonas sp.]